MSLTAQVRLFTKSVVVAAIFLGTISPAAAQAFYDMNTIQTIQVVFSQSNWDYMLDTATTGTNSYIMAQSVTINGETFDSVGVRYKGNSTYNANQAKNPFHIELDTYKDQDYQGYTDLKLSNAAKDPSFLREVLSYDILRQYMHAPLSNYANVYVNGNLIGLYINSESVSKKFVANHFYSNDNPFFKCNPVGGAGPGSSAKPNLVYLGADSALYYAAYELNSDYGWADLIELCQTLQNNTTAIEDILDVDRTLWMLAFDNVFVNLDSYIGGFAQNYYLYKDDYGRFNPVVWDLNESFGTFSQTGNGNLPNTLAKQQMTHLLHLTDANWPLIQKLLAIPKYKRMYIAHMRTILAENFANDSYFTTGQALQAIINNAVNADPNKFFTYTQYQNNLTSDISSGMTNAPGLTNLMDGRTTYLSGLADFTAPPPVISAINASDASPDLNSTVTISAQVTNTPDDAVYLGYRYAIDAPFTKILMLDDGAHGDGAAGDNVYGASVPVSAAFIQYYLYAENNNAGIFSPVRAEHEFYALYAVIPTVAAGDVVINEVLADNTSTAADQNGDFDDWIELYNNTDENLSLKDLYLSDSYNNLLKWQFPDAATITAHGYLVVWADEDVTQSGYHTNFKLSATGEKLILSYSNGTVVDSMSFEEQTTDISFQRCPDGTGEFVAFAPTFNSENCMINSNQDINDQRLSIFPNPHTGSCTISYGDQQIVTLVVLNSLGQQVMSKQDVGQQLELDMSSLPAGVYTVVVNRGRGVLMVKME